MRANLDRDNPRPPLTTYEALIWRGFEQLRQTSVSGMGITAIKWSDAKDYALYYEYTDPDEFIDIALHLDSLWVTAMVDKSGAK